MRSADRDIPIPNLLLLLGTAVSIMIAGTEDVWAIVSGVL